MKKITLIFLLLIMSLSVIVANDASEVWSRLYNRVSLLEQKYSIMQKVVLLDDPSLELMLTMALQELVEGEYYQYSQGDTKLIWSELTLMIIRELGELKAQDSAYLVQDVMKNYDGLLKAEAMIALGSMRAVEYSEEMATILRNLNFNLRDDRDIAEIEAYGAIVGLNRMSELVGFEPVFYASLGWYSRRVKSEAERTLPIIVEDPIDEIVKIMETASFEYRNIALQIAKDSSASNDKKSQAAAYAIELGTQNVGNNSTEKEQLRLLRNRGMEMLIEYEASIPESLPFLFRTYREAERIEDKLNAIMTLAVNGSDDAITFLVESMEFYNERMLGGLSPSNQEEQVIRQTLYALGISGNREIAMPLLSSIEIYGYSNSINRTAKSAMENF